MSLTLAQVNRIAHLARIDISQAEAEKTRDELNRIFELIEQMQAVDVSGVSPMSHALNVTQPLREDDATECDQRDAILGVAPETEAGLYLVPKVIE